MKPQWITILLNRTKIIYGFTITIWYLTQFIGAVAVINLYSDDDRLKPCSATGTLSDPDESSKVLDLPLLLLAIFHMIEWIRYTVLLTVVCIGTNISILYYIGAPNTLYGLIAYGITHIVYFSDDGKMCGEEQPDRYSWLLIEIIAFWVLYFFYIFPFVFTMCRGKAKAYQTLLDWKNAVGEDEDEEEEEK